MVEGIVEKLMSQPWASDQSKGTYDGGSLDL